MSSESLARAFTELGYVVAIADGMMVGRNDYKKFIIVLSSIGTSGQDGIFSADIRAEGNPDTADDIDTAFRQAGYVIDRSESIVG